MHQSRQRLRCPDDGEHTHRRRSLITRVRPRTRRSCEIAPSPGGHGAGRGGAVTVIAGVESRPSTAADGDRTTQQPGVASAWIVRRSIGAEVATERRRRRSTSPPSCADRRSRRRRRQQVRSRARCVWSSSPAGSRWRLPRHGVARARSSLRRCVAWLDRLVPTDVPVSDRGSDLIAAPGRIVGRAAGMRGGRRCGAGRRRWRVRRRRDGCESVAASVTRRRRRASAGAASSTRTTRRPLAPSERGARPGRMHSTKCSHSIRSGSTFGIRGEKMSPAAGDVLAVAAGVLVEALVVDVSLPSSAMSSKVAIRREPTTVKRRSLCGSSQDRCRCAVSPEGKRRKQNTTSSTPGRT